MNSKVSFIVEWEKQFVSFSELCRKHGVSRQTGYTIVERFEQQGWEGLEERSRAPHERPRAMDEGTRQELIDLRMEHPSWGPKKLKAWLEKSRGQAGKAMPVPARSTIGEMLDREGLIHRRRRKPGKATATTAANLSVPVESNDVWSVDFKGWFRTGDGRRCEPLTVTDNASRMLLRLVAAGGINGSQVRAVMESAFKEYGMPRAMRSDNGAPFASQAPGGLTELSVWWIRLGIVQERIKPGKPTQNGRHERFHLSLIRDCLDYEIGYDLRVQGRIFVRYREEFNRQRPHEALQMKTPESVWRPSSRNYPARVPEVEYEAGYQRRRVNEHGSFAWEGIRVPLSPVLAGEEIGLLEIDDDVYEVAFGPVCLGLMDGRTRALVRAETAEKWAKKATGPSAGQQDCEPGISPESDEQ
jgi:putative transposase